MIASRDYANYLAGLRSKRRSAKAQKRLEARTRARLTPNQRRAVLRKTHGRCHICGGEVGSDWHADHVLAFSIGGGHDADNFLAAHATCNNYRWDYSPEEFQEILKLGVWLRTQIERRTDIGEAAATKFVAYEAHRVSRRKRGLTSDVGG